MDQQEQLVRYINDNVQMPEPARAYAEANGVRIDTERDTRTVGTTQGVLLMSQLDVFEIRDNGENHIAIRREYYLGDTFVKGDAHVSILRGLTATAEKGAM